MHQPSRPSRRSGLAKSTGLLSMCCLLPLAPAAPRPSLAADTDRGKAAKNLLDRAYAGRHFYGEDFPGFKARVTCVFGNEKIEGKVTARSARDIEVELPQESARLWIHEQLSVIISHRTKPPERDEKSLYLEDDDGNPLGPKISVRDPSRTSFRVQDGKIREIQRDTPPVRFVVTTLDYAEAVDHKRVPRVLAVSYFDSATGRLLRTFVFHDTYRAVGKYSLPAKRVAVGSSDLGSHTVYFELTGHELLEAKRDL